MIQEVCEHLSCWQLTCMLLLGETDAIASHVPLWLHSEGGWEEGRDGGHFPVVSTAGQARNIAPFTLTLYFVSLDPCLILLLRKSWKATGSGYFPTVISSCYQQNIIDTLGQ